MDWPSLVPFVTYIVNSQITPKTGFSPSDLFLGRPSFRFEITPDPEVTPTVKSWLEDQLSKQEKASLCLEKKRQATLTRKNRTRRPHQYIVHDFVLVHKSRFPQRRFSKVESPWLGPFRILEVTSRKLRVAASPSLGGEIFVALDQCKSWKDIVEDSSDEDEPQPEDVEVPENDFSDALPALPVLNDVSFDTPSSSTNIAPLQNSPVYEVDKITKIKFKQGWKYLTFWKGFPTSTATWEPLRTFILPNGNINEALIEFCQREGYEGIIKIAEKFAKQIKRNPSRYAVDHPAEVADPSDIAEEEQRFDTSIVGVHLDIIHSSSKDTVPVSEPEEFEDTEVSPKVTELHTGTSPTENTCLRRVRFAEPLCTYQTYDSKFSASTQWIPHRGETHTVVRTNSA